jgi:hypothetical protein
MTSLLEKVHLGLSRASRWMGSLAIGIASVVFPVSNAIAQTVTLHAGGQYATDNPSGNDPGEEWTTAYLWLQDALVRAEELIDDQEADEVEIWVAAGTYYPDLSAADPDGSCDPGPCDRDATFELHDNVRIYGGFDGRETVLNDRDPIRNLTILSGDLAGDDDPDDPFDAALIDDNAYHVVSAIETDSTARIDGFTIRAGNADVDFNNYEGGGMFIVTADPVVVRCIFKNNRAGDGGAVKLNTSASPTIYNCTFIDNVADTIYAVSLGQGGAMSVKGDSTGVVLNCLFHGNVANSGQQAGTGRGGAVYHAAQTTFLNCTRQRGRLQRRRHL